MLSPTANLPPFPEGLSLAPIAVVSHQKLLDGDGDEASRVLAAAQSHGFFYLDLQGTSPGETLLAEAEQLHALAKAVFSVPLPEKRQYGLERGVSLFGYKPAGAVKTTDRDQRPDTTEFFSIAKDHLHHITPSRPYPPEIESHRPLLQSFTQHGHACGLLVLSSLASQLGLQPDAFANLNLFDEPSGDHCRLTHKPPDSNSSSDGGTTNNTIGLASHTDFGSVTVLFNWLGGLQIESSSPQTGGQPEWQWVKPLPGHAIVNLGDAMVTFTNSALKSAKHRVMPAPGAQGAADRYSVVYFVRPHNDVPMKPLDEFGGGANGTEATAAPVAGKFSAELTLNKGETLTAGEWMRRRAVQLGN